MCSRDLIGIPISELPCEVLCIIFLEVRNDAQDSTSLPVRARSIATWVKVTHVCVTWRSIALAYKQLWSTIYITPPVHLWAFELLHRSNPSPIQVFVQIPPVGSPAKYDKYREAVFALIEESLPQHMARCTQFEEEGLTKEAIHCLFNDIQTKALQKLHLSRGWGISSDLIVSDSWVQAPSLTTLTLDSVAVGWTSKLFRTLTHLELRNPDNAPTSLRRPLSLALSSLAEMPLLRYLALHNTFNDDDNPGGGSKFSWVYPKIDLHDLEYLKLTARMDTAANMLQNIVLPPSCIVSLAARWGNPCPISSNYVDVVSAISSWRLQASSTKDVEPHPSERSPSLNTLRMLYGPTRHHFGLDGYHEPSVFAQPAWWNEREPIIRLNFPPSRSWLYNSDDNFERNTVIPLLAAINVADITSLAIINSRYPQPCPKLWMSIFGPFKSLQFIMIGLREMVAFFEILLHEMPQPTSGVENTWTPSFPSLKSIAIQRVETSGKRLPGRAAFLIRGMYDSLSHRKCLGYAIEKLELPAEFLHVVSQEANLSRVVTEVRFLD